MSWTEIYPFLTDEMAAAYQEQATSEEKAQLDGWLAVDRVLNRQTGSNLVVVSLYRGLKRSQEVAFDSGYGSDSSKSSSTSWHELQSLLEGAAVIRERKKDTTLRVYLSADLVAVADQLTEAGCEVFLMKGACSSNSPAAMWRFLALEEAGRWITISHGNFGADMIHDVDRTEQVMAANLGGWRIPHLVGDQSQRLEARSYRPIHAAHIGAKGGFSTGLLMRALIWHCQRGTMPLGCVEGDGTRSYALAGSEWLSDDFDLWFLLAALYPRLAFEGLLTFLIWQRKFASYWYAVDAEYVTWANPASEILFTRKIITPDSPWNALPESNGVTVRPDTTVFRRRRRKIYEGSEETPARREVLAFNPLEGDLTFLLESAGKSVATKWWIDASPSLRSFPTGSELFCDRRYEQADVVVCGHYFLKITAHVTAWAAAAGLNPSSWKEAWICKLPKLEGPLTLWRTEFSRDFQRVLSQQPEFVRPELLLGAWMQLGKAVVKSTTAERMGWRLS